MLALQKLNELKINALDKNTTMVTDRAYSGQTAVNNDPSTPDGKPTIAQYIKKILLVSDNDAFNRLYEFLGQDYINDQMGKKGYSNVQILHRLGISLSPDENRHTNPVKFLSSQGTTVYNQFMQTASRRYPLHRDSIGKAFYSGGKINQAANGFFNKKPDWTTGFTCCFSQPGFSQQYPWCTTF